jgi:hypothetical protein
MNMEVDEINRYYSHRKIYSVLIIICTFILCLVFYFTSKSNVFLVYIDDKPIAYAKDKEQVQSLYKDFEKELGAKYTGVQIKSKIFLKKVYRSESIIQSYKLNIELLKDNCKVNVNAVVVKADNNIIAYLVDEKEILQLLGKIDRKYMDSSGIKTKDITENCLKNKISFVKCEVDYKSITSVDESVVDIIKKNEQKNDVPLLTFNISGFKNTNEVIEPGVVVTWSTELLKGQSKVQQSGTNGSVMKRFIFSYQNNKLIEEKLVSRTVIEAPTNKVIINGNKSPIIIDTSMLTVPSRGTISSPFGQRWGKVHEGVDIAAQYGTPIYSAFNGVVDYSGWEEGYGNLIQIKSDGNMETLYGHCSSLSVKVGVLVKKGDKIGNVGSTGNSTGPHVHFEVRINGAAVDPIRYLK